MATTALALLTATLADIDEHPSPDTAAFFTAIQHPAAPAPQTTATPDQPDPTDLNILTQRSRHYAT